MKRHVPLILAGGLSLSLCVATAILWALSHRDAGLNSHRGRIYAWRISYPPDANVSISVEPRLAPSTQWPGVMVNQHRGHNGRGEGIAHHAPKWSLLGIRASYGDLFATWGAWDDATPMALVRYELVSIPYWWPIVLATPIPALAVLGAIRRKRRLRNDRCLICGYDLRFTPTRCPECGTAPEDGRQRRPFVSAVVLLSASALLGFSTSWLLSFTDLPLVSHRGRLYTWVLFPPPDVELRTHVELRRHPPAPPDLNVIQQHGPGGYGWLMTEPPPRWQALGAEFWDNELYRNPQNRLRRYGPHLALVPYWLLALPHWWIVLATAALSITAAARVLRATRAPSRTDVPPARIASAADRRPESGH